MIAFVAACGAPEPVPFELPHHNQPAVAVSGVGTGGILKFDGRCVWLESESSASNLIWPSGFRALAPPLQIVGLSGRVVAREGDRLELGVADARAGVPGCPARGGAFLVGELTKVNGTPWPDGEPSLPPPHPPPIR
jgi:hypothetical protein